MARQEGFTPRVDILKSSTKQKNIVVSENQPSYRSNKTEKSFIMNSYLRSEPMEQIPCFQNSSRLKDSFEVENAKIHLDDVGEIMSNEHDNRTPSLQKVKDDYYSNNDECVPSLRRSDTVRQNSQNGVNLNPFTPSKALSEENGNFSQERNDNFGNDKNHFVERMTPNGPKKNAKDIFKRSPSFVILRKSPSALFAGQRHEPANFYDREKVGQRSDCRTKYNSDLIRSTPSTSFHFCTFPASLPRVRPRSHSQAKNQKNDSLALLDKGEELSQKCQTLGGKKGAIMALKKTMIHSDIHKYTDSDKKHIEELRSSLSVTEVNASTNHAYNHRSQDLSHDTSISSISVNSTLTLRSDKRSSQTLLNHIYSPSSGECKSKRESGLIENNWLTSSEFNDNLLDCDNYADDLDLSKNDGLLSGPIKVEGTKLNFNSLSPEMNNTQDSVNRNDRSTDFRPDNDANNGSSFPSFISQNFTIPHVKHMKTPRRTSNESLSFTNEESYPSEEFQYNLDATECSPILRSEESCSSASPNDMIVDKEPEETNSSLNFSSLPPSLSLPNYDVKGHSDDKIYVSEENNTSGFSMSSRKFRPMPDMSAFETTGPLESQSSLISNNRSATSATPIKLLCPPTPIRTPAWAHNDSHALSFRRQDSLISTKVLAACAPEVLDEYSSFENSLGDDNMDRSFYDTSCTPMKSNSSSNNIQSNWTFKSNNEDRNKFAKGQSGRFSTGNFSISASNNLISSSQKNLSLSFSRRDSFINKSTGIVGSIISFENDFENLGKLGRGNFADVFKVRSKSDNCLYAVKKNRRQFRGKRDRENALAEVRIMQRLQAGGKRLSDEKSKSYCPYLLLFIRAWQEDGYFFCQTELCVRGSCVNMMLSLSTDWENAKMKYPSLLRNVKTLEEYPDDAKGRSIPESTIWKICHDVVSGLSHIHSHHIVHSDIKPSNIFFVPHQNLGCLCKIGDFGLAGELDSIQEGFEGDAQYMPQELLSMNIKKPSADIFSFGLSLYELGATFPFDLPTDGPSWHQIRSGKVSFDRLHQRSKKLIDAIKKMIHPEPQKRPTANEILNIISASKDCLHTYDKFLSDYVKDVVTFDLDCERHLEAAQKEACRSRSTPTGNMMRFESQNGNDKCRVIPMPTPERFNTFIPVKNHE